jgi:hypothetical protein
MKLSQSGCVWCAALFLSVALTFCVAGTAAAQSAGSGTIVGHITDEKGGSVAGAKVTVRSLETNQTRSLTTNNDGEFRASLLQPGNYEVTVEAPGFGKTKRSPIGVSVGSTSAADISLKIAGVTEVITVTEQAPITDPEKVEVTTTVGQKQIEELPINGRRWDNFVLLTPGVSPDGTFGAISFRGLSGLLNNNTVDGADNNQAFFGEARGRTRVTSGTYSQAGIKEFQVGLSNFSSEFGRAAGGTVNAVTKSGSNAIHGEAFYFVRDDFLQAREPTLFDPSGNPLKNKDRRQQFGFAIGAPIIKDKLFFFGDAEEFHRTQTFLVRTQSTFLSTFTATCMGTSTNTQLAQNCNALLAFETGQSGQQPRKPINNVAFGKADWVISPNHTLTGSYNWQRWQSENGVQTAQIVSNGLSDNGKDIVKTDSVILRLSSIFSPTVINQAQFQWGRDLQSQLANSNDPHTSVTNGVSFGQSTTFPRPAFPDEKRYQWSDTLSWNRGRHAFKTGGDVNYVRELTINLPSGAGDFSYSGATAIQNLALDCPAPTRTGSSPCVPLTLDTTLIGKHYGSYTQGIDISGRNGTLFFTTTDWNFFFQDTFKWRPTVTINAGLRYEYQHMPSVPSINFNGTPVVGYPQFPESQSLNQDANNLGPRLAIAWDIGGKQKNVLRAGGGIYYGRTGNALIRNQLLENGVSLATFTISGSSIAASGPVYPAVLASGTLSTAGGRKVTFVAGDFVRPFISMVEAAYERELTRNISASVTLVYTRGNHLMHGSNINLPAPSTSISYFLNTTGALLATVPFYAGQRPFLDTLPGIAANTRLGDVIRATSDLNSTYSGAIFELKQRARFGITQNFSFTWSNAKDEGQVQGASAFAPGFEGFFDPRNRRAEYNRSEFDMRRRVVWAYIWEPSSIWKIQNKGLNTVLGDWSISGVTMLQDGQPYNPTVSGFLAGGANTTGTTACPSTGTCASSTGSINGSNGSLRPGWLPRTYGITTGFINFDMRLQKDWRLTETKRLRFIFEGFNVFNRANHPNRFNFVSTGFNISNSKACLAGSATMTCTAQNPSNLALPRVATITLASGYNGIIDPVTGSTTTGACLQSTCLSSASGTLFGPRDVEFALKFIF